jgi:hypothetical protein
VGCFVVVTRKFFYAFIKLFKYVVFGHNGAPILPAVKERPERRTPQQHVTESFVPLPAWASSWSMPLTLGIAQPRITRGDVSGTSSDDCAKLE